jgi:hypothetical protein
MLSLLPFLPDSFRDTLSRSSTASMPTFSSFAAACSVGLSNETYPRCFICPSDFTGIMVIANSQVAGCA